ncbi:hypothetical protein FRC01_000662 [Tulasnella sp. 417]|nr:hypothetical protein FRC01_000662 [Tulasnella sp. 417]
MIHALLRLTLLAVNVLDTFKILRPPKPRKGGTEPSARALAVRKRGMKGILCVWIVTACWLSVESISDRTVIYLTPFYNEIKTLCFMFLIFSRAAGAEPILLKVIRPLLRPYIQTIDSVLELLFMVAAFVLDLVFVPITLLKDRWAAFSAAAAADKESEPQEREARVGVPRPRRISVFSFWRDVVRDEPEDDAMLQTGIPPDDASDTESDDAAANKPPTPQPPKKATTVKPAQTTRNSRGAPAPFVPSPGLLSVPAPSAKPPAEPKRAEATVRQAQVVQAEVEDAQENVRQRMRARKEQPVSRPVSGNRSVSDGSTTRGRGKPTGSSTRTVSSTTSGSPASALATGTSPSDSSVNPVISSTPPQQQAFPTKTNQTHPQNIPPYSYVPAPPPEAASHTRHVSSPHLSPEIQKPLPLSPFAGIPSTSQTPASARFPPQQAPSTAQDPLAGIDIDAYFSTIGSPRGQRAVEDPSHGSSARVITGRPRPQKLDSEKFASHPAIPVELLKAEIPSETPPSPPSQYLGRPASNTPTRPQIPGSAPAKTPLAPGGFGWHDNSQRTEKNDADEGDDDEDEEDEDALGPEDSISVRGLRPSGEHRDQAPPPDTRPSTIFEFDLLKKQVEEEEAAEIRAYAQALATLGITNGNHSNGALGLTAGTTDNLGVANPALRIRTKAPVVAQKRSSEYLDERVEGTSLRARNATTAPSDEANKKRRVAPPVAAPPSASVRTRSSMQQIPREGARSASGSSASEAIAHTRTRSAQEGMPSSSSRPVAQAPEISQTRRPRPRNAQ